MKHLRFATRHRARRLALGLLAVPSCLAACFMLAGVAAPASAGAAAPASARAAAPVAPHPVLAARYGALGHLTSAHRAGQAGPFGLAQPASPNGQAPRGGAAAAGTVVLTGTPGFSAVNPKTSTVYVAIQCVHVDCMLGQPEHVVDVVNTAKCNGKDHSGCRVAGTIRVGTGPLGVAVDPRTDTIYVTNGNDNTVSVINGARCNAEDLSGCATAVVATVSVGKFPVADAFDPATRTLYVANLTGSISVINAATCNATTTSGCGHPVRSIPDKRGPAWIDIDQATGTVYAADSGTSGEGGDTVSVIDGGACNGHAGTGCKVVATATVGANPFTVAVDQATNTIYTANHDGVIGGQAAAFGSHGSVSVINGAACNARITSGCRQAPATVPAGANTSYVAADDARHTVFAVNEFDDTLSAINTETCGGKVTSGCGLRPPNEQAEPDQGPGYVQFPTAFTLLAKASTAYVMDTGGMNRMVAVSIARCNAISQSGCRHEAPTVRDHDAFLAEDPATRTIYAGNMTRPRIDVISAAACHPGRLSGCAPVAAIPMPDPQANMGGIDQATHTLYAADPFNGKVAVIDTAACNATHTSGCSAAPPLMTVGPNPGPPGVNPLTKTVYVPDGPAFNRVAVINAATCNATDTSGCGQTPAQVTVAKGTFVLAVSPATDTVYASATGLFIPGKGSEGRTIAVINGATCNGADYSGCGHLAATIRAGRAPYGMSVDDQTHTLYTAINTSGGFPGSVAVINTATCNGARTAGCHGPFPHMPTGATPIATALDTSTGFLYVTNGTSAEVTALRTAHCNATDATGCKAPGRRLAVSSSPNTIAVDPRGNTVYVTNAYQTGALTVFAGLR
jgi:DNA-binding beta-propeller fold protein YncE